MRFLTRSLTGLFLLSLTVGLLAWAGHIVYAAVVARLSDEGFQKEARERVFAVHVVTYETQDISPVLTAFGQVRSQRILELRAPSSGTITTLSEQFVDGGRVTAGEMLMQVNRAEAEAAVARAQADLAQAEAERHDAALAYDLSLEELDAAEERARLQEAALARQRDLRTRGVGTEAAIEAAELTLSAARQTVLAQRRAVAQADARRASAETGIARSRIDLSEAERALADTSLFAAFSGTLGEVTVVEGGLVANNERLGVLTDPTRLEVSFRVSAAQYARLLDTDGQLVSATIEVRLGVIGADLISSGTLSRESATVGDDQTGRLLFARLEPAPTLRPGDFVEVQVREPKLSNVARLPATALGPLDRVLVIGDDERLKEVAVTLLRRQGDDVLVRTEDLNGAAVVAARTPLLGAGIKVRPIRQGSEAAGHLRSTGNAGSGG